MNPSLHSGNPLRVKGSAGCSSGPTDIRGNADLWREILRDDSFAAIDRQVARFLEARCGGTRPELVLAAALLGRAQRQGHICLDLAQLAGRPVTGETRADPLPWVCPELDSWCATLRALPVVGQLGEFKPLVLDSQHRLYFHRYWAYEERLAANLLERARSPAPPTNPEALADGLTRLFGPAQPGTVNWQKIAAFAATRSRLTILSGGPGTGKTRTVVCLLTLFLEQDPGLRIALAAPTGKAAARLKETLEHTRGLLACTDAVRDRLPTDAVTVHRLLGTLPDSPYFRRRADNPLELDVLVVDETSMVDLALMAKLVDALPPSARLILVGDKDQLAPVEAGHVFGDLCRAGHPNGFSETFARDCAGRTGESVPSLPPGGAPSPLVDRIVQLERNYRFGEQSAIGRVSQAINRGNAEGARAALGSADSPTPDLRWSELPRPDQLADALRALVLDHWQDVVVRGDPRASLERFNRFRILCAVRQGPYGVIGLNRIAEDILREAGALRQAPPFHEGRPLLITRNDYTLGVFNGDVGIVLGDPAGDDPRACFQTPDGSLRAIPPARLPEHETAYAMTVHKSQGSEFDRVLLVLPDRDSPVLTRELVYTGITRARAQVVLWLPSHRLEAMVTRSIERGSGLTDRLRGARR